MIDEAELNYFFAALKERREAFKENYSFFAPKLTPQFNCFNFIRPDEMRLSEILASLLNPNSDHAQGDTFLKLFLDMLELDYPYEANSVTVACEVITDKIENPNRRIDIEINFGDNIGLAIENKPWASDQKDQLKDYAEQMQGKFKKNWCLVYLSGYDNDPSPESVSPELLKKWTDDNQYKQLNFGQIVEWLKQCEAQCQSDHVRHFLRDFMGYCKQTFLGEANMVDADLIKKFALEKQNLEITLEIGRQMTAIKQELLKKFVRQLEEEFKKEKPEWEFYDDENFAFMPKWNPLRFYKHGWNNYSLAVEFEQNQCDGFYWGIKKNEKNTSDLAGNYLDEFRKKLNPRGNQSQRWPWSCNFKPPYKNWSQSSQPWLEIQSDECELAKMVVKTILELADVSENIIDEAEERLTLTTTPTN